MKKLILVLILSTTISIAFAQSQPPILYVVQHSPGPLWDHTRPFRDQDGVMKHVAYFGQLDDSGKIFLGGPFTDNTGGMVILKAVTAEEAAKIAQEDPTVQSGLLSAKVSPWMTVMGTL